MGVGLTGVAFAGCDQYDGIGGRSGQDPTWSPSLYGFSVDFYGDGRFRLNADPVKVCLWGL
jgi:hypothetical protein